MKLLLTILMMIASTSFGQVLRPGCSDYEQLMCDLSENLGWGWQCTCEEDPRVMPPGPPHDPWAGSYMLPRTIGVTQLAYEPEPVQPPRTAHMTSYELLQEVLDEGFGSLKLWMDSIPFEGMGEWCWKTYYGEEICAEYDLEGLEMERFWEAIPDGMVIFLRPQSPAWTFYKENPCILSDGDGPAMALADYYAISKRLYELIGDHSVQIVFTDWEQDWQSCQEDNGGQPFMLQMIEKRQMDVERARREEWLRLGHKPKLEIYHAVVVNKYPNNEPDWKWPYLTEMIPTLEHRPDFIGLSYWLKGHDPIETLQWISDTTGYPPHRIYIDEIGSNELGQSARFYDYVPTLWDWGVRTINVWMWKQTWCAVPVKANKGLWKQKQPCFGRVEFTEPTDGLIELRRLMR